MKKCANNKPANDNYWKVYTAQYFLFGFLGLFDIPPLQILNPLIAHIIKAVAQPV